MIVHEEWGYDQLGAEDHIAVVMRDGFAFIYPVNADKRVMQTKVQIGRTVGDRLEILTPLAAGTQVVATGAGFLNDGDLVRVAAPVTSPIATPVAAPATK